MSDIENGDESNNGAVERKRDEDVSRLPEHLFAELMANPLAAPRIVALAAVRQWGVDARDYATRVKVERPDATGRELAEMVKKRHLTLARSVGVIAALPTSVSEGNPVVSAPPGLLLVWIQSRMVVHIAAVYGRETTTPDMVAELMALQGAHALASEPARLFASRRTMRYVTRTVNTHLKGETLKEAKRQFKRVGVNNFTRAGLLRTVPYLAVPVSVGVNEASTRWLANRAISLYDANPSSLQPAS
jgi:hypothetical protein